jgi:hypothetical protein
MDEKKKTEHRYKEKTKKQNTTEENEKNERNNVKCITKRK